MWNWLVLLCLVSLLLLCSSWRNNYLSSRIIRTERNKIQRNGEIIRKVFFSHQYDEDPDEIFVSMPDVEVLISLDIQRWSHTHIQPSFFETLNNATETFLVVTGNATLTNLKTNKVTELHKEMLCSIPPAIPFQWNVTSEMLKCYTFNKIDLFSCPVDFSSFKDNAI